jgi:RNA-splicing ligase RtcB
MSISSVHNFIGDDTIIRKGAISAKKGKKLLIPINMRDGILIGYGKGNPDYNWSAPHGAGRLMSRTGANNILSLDEFKKDMAGIWSTSINEETLDESPRAYKDMDFILDNIKDTVDVVSIMKPVYSFKDDSKPIRKKNKNVVYLGGKP